jgi:signal transduction histidine kinase
VDTERLIAEVINSLQEPAREARSVIRLIRRTPPGKIRCDPTALRLVLENLLLNAIRHGLPDDRSADKPAEIRLIVEQKVFQGGLIIAVEDDGPGIPPREARRVFDPFVRGEASIREQRPGSGLGLHLVRRVVQILGGSITLDSPYRNAVGRTQKGCRFTVVLPAVTGAAERYRRENRASDAEDPDR